MSDETITGNLTVQNQLNVEESMEIAQNVHIRGNLQVSGNAFAFGGLQIDGSLGHSNSPMPIFYMFQSGSSNPERPLISHSPAYPTWGLSYRDQTDSMIFQQGGKPVLTVSLSQQRVGIGTDSPTAALDVRGKIRSQNARHEIKAANRIGTFSTNWENMPNMMINVRTQDNPVMVLFRSGGVQPSTPYKNARLFFRLLVDGQVKDSSMNEFGNNGWEMRDISLQCLQRLTVGVHTVQVQWRTEKKDFQNNVCWGRENTRSLIVVEL